MTVRYRVELNQEERDQLGKMLSGGKHAGRKLNPEAKMIRVVPDNLSIHTAERARDKLARVYPKIVEES